MVLRFLSELGNLSALSIRFLTSPHPASINFLFNLVSPLTVSFLLIVAFRLTFKFPSVLILGILGSSGLLITFRVQYKLASAPFPG